MTDPHAALTALICEHSALSGARAGRLADKIAAEWLPAQGVVDREALVDALMTDDMREHGWGHEREITLGWADDILAAGVITDAADVRRQTAETIATAIEDAAEGSTAYAWLEAARLAREVGGRA